MLEEIVEPLTDWYEKNHRSLPWREEKNPYYIWISEIMLQQTRVEAVKAYFERFIRELPTVKDAACCPQERLLKLWEGLGYYNRVKNIQKAAVCIMEKYDGVIPADYDLLLELPGIGAYTAGAVASIAYDIPVPAVDGNVLRVVSRITESREDIGRQSVKNAWESRLRQIIPKDRPGTFNQALMELGAMVCVPNGPAKCEICPAAAFCQARIHGTVGELPIKKKAKERRLEKKTVLVIRDGERVAIRRRPSRGLLAGLYELPNLEGHLDEGQILEWVSAHRLTPLQIRRLADSRHIFSHVEWEMTGYLIRVAALEEGEGDGMLFAERTDVTERYPVPAAFAAYAAYMKR